MAKRALQSEELEDAAIIIGLSGAGQLNRWDLREIRWVVVHTAFRETTNAPKRHLSAHGRFPPTRVLHMPPGSEHRLKNSLGRFTRVPIVSVESSERLRHGTIFVPPPGESAIFRGGMIIVDRVAVPERPINTINRLYASAADIYGSRLIGVGCHAWVVFEWQQPAKVE